MNYPKEIKAFYMRLNDDGKTVAAMDVLAPGIGEIIGGSQREERLDVLDARMDELGLDQAALRLVPRPAPLRHRAARRLRPRLRAHRRLRDRAGERARRHPVPAHAGQRQVLMPRIRLATRGDAAVLIRVQRGDGLETERQGAAARSDRRRRAVAPAQSGFGLLRALPRREAGWSAR